MIKISPLIISIVIPQPDLYLPNHYAQNISYEDICIIEAPPNKNTMEYNVLNMEEMIQEQNQKIYNNLFREEDEYLQHYR